jgi:HEAT repeat protein
MRGREAKERLIAFASGELPPADRRAIDDLIVNDERFRQEASGTLGNCRLLADRLGRLSGLFEVDPAVLEAAPEPEPKKEARPAAAPPKALLLGIAAAVLAAGVGGWFLFKGDGEPPADVAGTAAAVREEPEKEPDREPPPEKVDRPEWKEPESEPETKREPRPVTVKPGVAMLLPRLIRSPSQAGLERAWAALREKPQSVSIVTTRIPTVADETKRAALVLVLAALNDERGVRADLAEILRTDSSPMVRRAAAGALGHVRGNYVETVRATTRLSVRAGKLTDAEQRQSLVHAAGEERDPTVIAVLILMLGPSQSEDRGITERLLELTRSPNADLRRAAIASVASGARTEVVEDLVNDTAIPAKDRAPLVAMMVQRRLAGVVQLQRLIESSREEEIRVAAVEALPLIVVKGWIPVAIGVLENTRETRAVRLAALGVVGARSDKRCVAAIRKAAEADVDESVRAAAKEMLRAKAPKKKED